MKGLLYIVCCLLLLLSGVGYAQERYNRWDARPAPKVPTASAEERGKKVLLLKARQDSFNAIKHFKQDSLRIIAIAPTQTHLQRGVKQRIKEHQGQPADVAAYAYIQRAISYPITALRAGTEGIVKVRLFVNSDGRVIQTEIIESTIPPDAEGRGMLLQQARLIMKGLQFVPAAGMTEEELGISYRIL